ncbi:hypothetical protein ACPA54_30065 [Uniformispora flossi]
MVAIIVGFLLSAAGSVMVAGRNPVGFKVIGILLMVLGIRVFFLGA